jgi:hypothetical protein
MSTDRIEFVLTSATKERDATARAAKRAFGMVYSQAFALLTNNDDVGTKMRCRPSQFGRFIVFRIEEGVGCNRVAELKPKIIPGETDCVLDVSKNPR